ncbi:MAG: hypothetical protein ACLFQA_01305 [Bacteroidales bacterium]
MMTLEKSKELLLKEIKKKFYWHINGLDNYSEKCTNVKWETSRKIKEVYFLLTALPPSNQVFEWFRSNSNKIQIEMIDDKIKIYKIESQYLEQIEFGEGDLCNLIYKALEYQN